MSSKSVFRISSLDEDNPNFGTGFAIHHEKNLTYILTCAHVVDQFGRKDRIKVNGLPACFMVWGKDLGIDLAIVTVENLDCPSLILEDSGKKGMAFHVSGFSEFDKKKNEFILRPLTGKLGSRIAFESDSNRVTAWDLIIDDEFFLKPGYSGSPVFCEETGTVFAVASHRQGDGKKGNAISVICLQDIWENIPSDLFDKKNGHTAVMQTKVKKEISFSEKTQIINALLTCPCMQDNTVRNQIVMQLPPKIYNSISYASQNKIHVMNIFNTCLNYKGGLTELLNILRFIEEDSDNMQKLDEIFAQFFPGVDY